MPRSSSRLMTKTCSKGSLKTVAVGGFPLDIKINRIHLSYDMGDSDQRLKALDPTKRMPDLFSKNHLLKQNERDKSCLIGVPWHSFWRY